jgi:hypothetical protein
MVNVSDYDNVFLKLSWKDLEETRSLQSDYVKNKTKYNDIEEATSNNNLDNIQWLHSKIIEHNELARKATRCYSCQYNMIGCNDCILNKLIKLNHKIFNIATRNDNIIIMNWLLDNGYKSDHNTFSIAAENGSRDTMKWLVERHIVNGATAELESLINNNDSNSNIDNIIWLVNLLRSNNINIIFGKTFESVVLDGDLELMSIIYPLPYSSNRLFDNAIENGNKKIINWLLKKGFRCYDDKKMIEVLIFLNIDVQNYL